MAKTLLCTDCDATFRHEDGEARCPSCGFGRVIDTEAICVCCQGPTAGRKDSAGEHVCEECWPHLVADYDDLRNDVNDDCALGRISRPDVIGGV